MLGFCIFVFLWVVSGIIAYILISIEERDRLGHLYLETTYLLLTICLLLGPFCLLHAIENRYFKHKSPTKIFRKKQ